MKPTHPPHPESDEPREHDEASSLGPAERLYLEFAQAAEQRAPAEREAAFEALCAAHPEQAAELRRLRTLAARKRNG